MNHTTTTTGNNSWEKFLKKNSDMQECRHITAVRHLSILQNQDKTGLAGLIYNGAPVDRYSLAPKTNFFFLML